MDKKIVISNKQLDTVYSRLKSLPTKNPLSYEISRVIKQVVVSSKEFVENQLELMSTYLLTNEDGEYLLKEETKKAISEYKEKNIQVQPNAFGFIVSNEELEEEYHQKLQELFDTEVKLVSTPVVVDTKFVYINEEKLPLTEVLSNYFSSEDILFLEEIGLLVIN